MPFAEKNHKYSLQIFDCQIHVMIVGKIVMVCIVQSISMDPRRQHLLQLWMKHFYTQIESEFTPKIIQVDVPYYEYANPEKFQYY